MPLKIQNITYASGGKEILKNLSFSLDEGSLYGVLGPNGSGKSTLLKTMAKIWSPIRGEIFWHQENLMNHTRLQMSRTMTLVPQNPQIYFDFDVLDFTAMGCYPRSSSSEQVRSVVEEALRQVGAWHLCDRFISQLSGGERQLIYIARALATQAPILLLDEPTSHLDLHHQLQIWELLRSLVDKGKLIIVAVHDFTAAQRFCDQIVVLSQGECKGVGSYQEVMTPTLLQEIFGVRQRDPFSFFERV